MRGENGEEEVVEEHAEAVEEPLKVKALRVEKSPLVVEKRTRRTKQKTREKAPGWVRGKNEV